MNRLAIISGPLRASRGWMLALIGATLGLVGCTTTSQTHLTGLEAELRPVSERLVADGQDAAVLPGGRLEEYLTYAMERSPALRASYEQWRAEIARVGSSDKWPEPTLSYGLFIRRVETRVGPQRHRFGLRQRLPWPDKLSASADVAAAGARAAGQRFEAQGLSLRRRVGDAWWGLWAIDQTRQIRREQLLLLQQLSASVRGRLEIGQANVSELNQLDLTISRLADTLEALDATERAASARLVAAIGAPAGTLTPVALEQPFVEALPGEDEQTLLAVAEQHPMVQEQSMLMEQSRALRSRAEADRYPDLMVGLDYIETGERTDAMPEDNGKDPVLATISIELPIWFDAYAAAERGAESQQRSRAAQRIAMKDEVQAQILDAMATLRDSHRRVGLFRDTLIPQAETTYAAVLGDYETGQATIATMLLAYRELLELRLGLIRAQADHAKAWVWLESVVGRPVHARRVTP